VGTGVRATLPYFALEGTTDLADLRYSPYYGVTRGFLKLQCISRLDARAGLGTSEIFQDPLPLRDEDQPLDTMILLVADWYKYASDQTVATIKDNGARLTGEFYTKQSGDLVTSITNITGLAAFAQLGDGRLHAIDIPFVPLL
jgi:hypothetical protein